MPPGFPTKQVTYFDRLAQHVTTHYSAADIGNLIAASEKVCDLAGRNSPAVTIVRARGFASA